MQITYFATDGNYGDAEDIFICDTSKWSPEEIEAIEMAGDISRIDVAMQIAANYEKDSSAAQLKIDYPK